MFSTKKYIKKNKRNKQRIFKTCTQQNTYAVCCVMITEKSPTFVAAAVADVVAVVCWTMATAERGRFLFCYLFDHETFH